MITLSQILLSMTLNDLWMLFNIKLQGENLSEAQDTESSSPPSSAGSGSGAVQHVAGTSSSSYLQIQPPSTPAAIPSIGPGTPATAEAASILPQLQ